MIVLRLFARGSLVLAALLLAGACIRNTAGSKTAASHSSSNASEGGPGGFDSVPEFPEIVRADHMLRGVSLAGADFGEGTLPGTHGKEYVYPDAQYANGYASPAYFRKKGM